MATVYTIGNQKGGVAKTTTAAALGFGLARQGQRVLLIETDAQASLTVSLGIRNMDDLHYTMPCYPLRRYARLAKA